MRPGFAAVIATVVATAGGAPPGLAQARKEKVHTAPASVSAGSCKPQPLSESEARKLLEKLAYISKNPGSYEIEPPQREGVWFSFEVSWRVHCKNVKGCLGYSTFADVNEYTADIVNPIPIDEAGNAKLVRGRALAKAQEALRRSHCFGPTVLKKYRAPKYWNH